MSIGQRIITARTAIGWSQKQLATELEQRGIMTQQNLSLLEIGKVRTTTKLPQICDLLGIYLQWARTGDGAMWVGETVTPALPVRLMPLIAKLQQLDEDQKLSPELVRALLAVADLACPPTSSAF
ncbi:helix-turn-helix domain-containing protein [Chitinimonas naiadis]